MADRTSIWMWIPRCITIDKYGSANKEKQSQILSAIGFMGSFDMAFTWKGNFLYREDNEVNHGGIEICDGLSSAKIPFILFHGAGDEYSPGLVFGTASGGRYDFDLNTHGDFSVRVDFVKGRPVIRRRDLIHVRYARAVAARFKAKYGLPYDTLLNSMFEKD